MQKRIVLEISGRVQGVFFRDSSWKKAGELGLVGWVKNDADGFVRIVAEGGERALQELIAWCKDGPEHAKVERVDVKWVEPTGELDGFLIK